MSEDPEETPAAEDAALVFSDGEHLLVIGNDKRSVERYMRSKGILERAQEIRAQHFAPMLRTAAQVGHTISETIAESGLWVKLTEDSAEARAKFGLIESDIPGISYAVAGDRGNIKQWLKFDTSASAKVTNPRMLSGIAGGLAQAASQAEAERLREMLASMDEKLDQLRRDNRDEILGDIGGIEEHLHDANAMLTAQGELDSQEWDTLTTIPLQLKQIRRKAVLKVEGVADDMAKHKKVGDLKAWLPQAKQEVQLWLSTIARSIAALDDFAVLELEHTAAIAPEKLDAKRQGIQEARATAIADLTAGITELMKRMSETAEWANKNVLANHRTVPKVLAAIEDARGVVKRLYDVLGLEVDWESLTPERWPDALKQAQQWKNALAQGGTFVKEKGGPAAAWGVGIAASTIVAALINGKGSTGDFKTPET
ncbi:hypothetical protein [Microbacterium arborescens]|uniref:hypothetical protein n=1 Tax=Microbacterium arborescens TaxID=33883 RepID=UPI003C773FDD